MNILSLANLPWKNLSILAAVVTAVLATLNYTYEAGRTSMRVEIQAKHNALIEKAHIANTEKIQKEVEKYNTLIAENQKKTTQYYENLLAKQESDLITKYKNKLKILEIAHGTENITDVISPDSLQLFQQATGIITPPRNYRDRATHGS